VPQGRAGRLGEAASAAAIGDRICWGSAFGVVLVCLGVHASVCVIVCAGSIWILGRLTFPWVFGLDGSCARAWCG
jgi:hypothetical protein